MSHPATTSAAIRRWARTRRRKWVAAFVVVPTAMAVSGLASTASATPSASASRVTASTATATTVTAKAAKAGGTGTSIALPGLTSHSYTVTLISGDRVRLVAAGGGRYAVSTVPTPASSSAVIVRAHSMPGAASTIQAMPLAAQGLVGSGQLDPGLFDLTYLAAHGDTRPAAQLPVTLQYADHPTAATLRADAGRLPGSRVVGMSKGGGGVEVEVAAAQAGAFWAALTGRPGTNPAVVAGAHLTGGVSKVWLTGHQSADAAPRPQAAGPTSTVTVTVTKKTGAAVPVLCSGPLVTETLCLPILSLTGISGPGAGQVFGASFACVDQNPCNVQTFSFTVPDGIYSVQGWGFWQKEATPGTPADDFQVIDVINPQITVAGDSSLAINADAAKQITISTPRPVLAQAFSSAIGESRELPDGETISDLALASYPFSSNYWATPAAQPVTVGEFHFDSSWELGEPPLTAAITTPEHLDLHPLYPNWYNADSVPPFYTRFSGKHAYSVVDAGDGTKADFAKINARGKLVMLRLPDPDVLINHSEVWEAQFTNALAAGAAGILYNKQFTSVPWQEVQEPQVDIPVAGILPTEDRTLHSLLSRGPAKVTIDDHGPVHYLYALNFDHEGRVPGSLHYTVGSSQLSTRQEHFHMSQPIVEEWAAFTPNQQLAGAPGYGDLAGPTTVTEYFGPESPDLLWQRFPETGDGGNIAFNNPVFAQHGGNGTDDWYVQPTAPGAPETPFASAQPGRAEFFCVNCRQGNVFVPFTYGVSGASPQTTDGGFTWAPNSPDIHLFDASGKAIAPTSFLGVDAFQLPPQRGHYKLVAQSGNASSTWGFTSSEPTADHTPPGTACPGTELGASSDPCQADPLVYLRYNAFTNLSNSVTAPGTHRLRITAYHETAGAPPITSLTVSISSDGGSTWRRLTTTKPDSAGTYLATYTLPALARTSGTLSIKVHATDANGNDITQTIRNAVQLIGGS